MTDMIGEAIADVRRTVGESLYLLVGAAVVCVLLLVRTAQILGSRWRNRWFIPESAVWSQGAPSSDAGADAPSADQIYYEVAARFLDAQVGTSDVLDTKSAGILQVGSTILPLTFGLLAVSGRTLPTTTVALLVLALLAYIVLLVFGWRASAIRAIEYRPRLANLQEHSQGVDGTVLRRWVSEEYAASTATNRPVLLRKARYVGVANTALFVEGLFASATAVPTLL